MRRRTTHQEPQAADKTAHPAAFCRSENLLVDGSDVETQWSTCTNGAQTSLVAGAEPREVMPLVSYRASAEAVLRWERSDRVLLGGAGNAVTEWSPGCTRSMKSQAIDSPPNKASNQASRLPSEHPRISPDWIGIFPKGLGRCPSDEGKSTYQLLTFELPLGQEWSSRIRAKRHDYNVSGSISTTCRFIIASVRAG